MRQSVIYNNTKRNTVMHQNNLIQIDASYDDFQKFLERHKYDYVIQMGGSNQSNGKTIIVDADIDSIIDMFNYVSVVTVSNGWIYYVQTEYFELYDQMVRCFPKNNIIKQ